jgi:hypothetical protein
LNFEEEMPLHRGKRYGTVINDGERRSEVIIAGLDMWVGSFLAAQEGVREALAADSRQMVVPS